MVQLLLLLLLPYYMENIENIYGYFRQNVLPVIYSYFSVTLKQRSIAVKQ